MSNRMAWIKAARLRTLPLALSCVVLAAFIAAYRNSFSLKIFLLATLTTILLQVLANFANDYGDALNGADNEDRIGPDRMVQSGTITESQMKRGIIWTIIFTLISGVVLLYISFDSALLGVRPMGLLILGLLSIAAAIKYTAGKNPYGYIALGDLSVFFFFGILGVLGNVFLYTQSFVWNDVLPAVSIGTLSMAVLNLNNMRDRLEDAKVGKRTIPVLIGPNAAKAYHFSLIITALVCAVIYTSRMKIGYSHFIYLIPFVILIIHLLKVLKTQSPRDFDPELKKVALSTFMFSILFGLGIMISL